MLGVLVGPERSHCLSTLEIVVDKMKIRGAERVFVTQTFAIPSVHVVHVLPVTVALVDAINTDLWRLIWAVLTELVSRRVHCFPPCVGGLFGIIICYTVCCFEAIVDRTNV